MTSLTKQMEREAKIIASNFPISEQQAGKIVASSYVGGEVDQHGDFDAWLRDRFTPNTIILNQEDYLLALTQALRVAPNLAGSDYGTSRQRDLGQLWTDTARGFLGEVALGKLLKQRFGVTLNQDYTVGRVEDYLDSDIKSIVFPDGRVATPHIDVSVKATKFNGLWLDVPGAQPTHSQAFFLAKLGIEREHFLAFLKDMSFVKDKLLPAAVRHGMITEEEATETWNRLPLFTEIACYFPGYISQDDIQNYKSQQACYTERRTRQKALKHYEITQYIGYIRNGKPDNVPAEVQEKYEFTSIGTFSKSDHFVSSTGFLRGSEVDWKKFLADLTQMPVA